MQPFILSNLLKTITRQMEALIRIEYCVVLEIDRKGDPGVQNHSFPDSLFYNTCSIKGRMLRQRGVENAKKYEHLNCIVLQSFVGNRFGTPWTPRVGDMVAVLFLFNNKPIILGSFATLEQPPVCRGPASPMTDGQYDRVDKWCQWQKPKFDDNLDAYDHPQGKMPICEKLFHGPPKGETGPGRDFQVVYDCKKGDKDPTCKDCVRIDSVPRCGEAWDKVYSEDSESCEAPHKRMERHAKCGSYIRLESECGKSLEYSEGQGHIRIGNAVVESEKKGHINFQGSKGGSTLAGTIDMHSMHEEVPFASEQQGARVSVVAPTDDSALFATEMINFDTGSFIRIMKDGDIVAYTPFTATIEADVGIDLVTPLVHCTQDMQIDGYCSHGTRCSCIGIGGSGWEDC